MLTVDAVHRNGVSKASATRRFTVGDEAIAIVVNTYDGAGRVLLREWVEKVAGEIFVSRTQRFTWDPFGNLVAVAQRSFSGDGYEWAASYDAFGRRLTTAERPVRAGAPAGAWVEVASSYDPLVEFLEIGVSVGGRRALKVYGPDGSGAYGGAQGVGGLEGVVIDGVTTPVVDNLSGDIVATVGAGGWTPLGTAVGAYGPLPGQRPKPLRTVGDLVETLAWRGRRQDTATGFYCLGVRHYEPASGRFLSSDPLGHASDMTLYAFAGGDPVNQFDPTGRVAANNWNKVTIVSMNVAIGGSEFAMGAGDALSFGLASRTAQAVYAANGDAQGAGAIGDSRCSGAYKGGEIAGTALGLAAGAGGVIGKLPNSSLVGSASKVFGKGTGLLDGGATVAGLQVSDVARIGWGFKQGTGQVFRGVIGGNRTAVGRTISDVIPAAARHFDFTAGGIAAIPSVLGNAGVNAGSDDCPCK